MNAVQQFQKDLGVEPDGSIGALTLEAFRNKYNKSKSETAHFFGQVSHETGGFKVFEENLRYSATRLMQVFGKYFATVKATKYAYNERKIANRVYANRMGNGNEESGDGYTYRGRGALQLTGKNNYNAFNDYLGKCIPEDLVSSVYAFNSALFYFDSNKLWTLCNYVTVANVRAVTKKINGGYNGLEDRQIKTEYYLAIQK